MKQNPSVYVRRAYPSIEANYLHGSAVVASSLVYKVRRKKGFVLRYFFFLVIECHSTTLLLDVDLFSTLANIVARSTTAHLVFFD